MRTRFTYDARFDMGATVYLKTDVNQEKWIVIQHRITPENAVLYLVACGPTTYLANEIELSECEDKTLKLGV